jgi:FixJ family two-component response regulator
MGSPTIFVIDDDEVVRDSLKILLELRHYSVRDFSSAAAFLAGREEAPDGSCLLLDIHMPGMTGIDLLRQLRGRGDRIPTIFMTGRRDTTTQTQAHSLGAIAMLDKPISHPALFQAIDRALGRP